jgi:hypothetical protein
MEPAPPVQKTTLLSGAFALAIALHSGRVRVLPKMPSFHTLLMYWYLLRGMMCGCWICAEFGVGSICQDLGRSFCGESYGRKNRLLMLVEETTEAEVRLGKLSSMLRHSVMILSDAAVTWQLFVKLNMILRAVMNEQVDFWFLGVG